MSLLPFGRNSLRRSSLPKEAKSMFSSAQLHSAQSDQTGAIQSRNASRLTLTQALTITAGMAGLVGLLSGVLVRFSLANSSNARFLSPFQTFPELSEWSSEAVPSAATDSTALNEISEDIDRVWQAPTDLEWETNDQDFDTFSSEGFTDTQPTTELIEADSAGEDSSRDEATPFLNTESVRSDEVDSFNVQNFDVFANRAERQLQTDVDPFEALSKGPLLRKTADDNSLSDDFYEATSQESIRNGREYDSINNLEIEGSESTLEGRRSNEPRDEYSNSYDHQGYLDDESWTNEDW